jgi:hypothetical protein
LGTVYLRRIIYLVLRVIMVPISGLRRVMVKMRRDNRIRVDIWGQELGTRRKRWWKRWGGQMSTMMMI